MLNRSFVDVSLDDGLDDMVHLRLRSVCAEERCGRAESGTNVMMKILINDFS